MLDQFVPRVGIDLCPCFSGAVFFHVAAVRPDQEIVEAHARNLGAQFGRKIVAQLLDLRGAIGLGAALRPGDRRASGLLQSRPPAHARTFAVDFADQLDARGEQSLGQRVARRRLRSRRGFWLKNSKLRHQSKM